MNDDPDRSLAAAPAQQRTKAAAGQSAPKPAGTPHDLTRDLQRIQRMLQNADSEMADGCICGGIGFTQITRLCFVLLSAPPHSSRSCAEVV